MKHYEIKLRDQDGNIASFFVTAKNEEDAENIILDYVGRNRDILETKLLLPN